MNDSTKILLTVLFAVGSAILLSAIDRYLVVGPFYIAILFSILSVVPVVICAKSFMGCTLLGLISGIAMSILLYLIFHITGIFNYASIQPEVFVALSTATTVLSGIGVYPMKKTGSLSFIIVLIPFLIMGAILQYFYFNSMFVNFDLEKNIYIIIKQLNNWLGK